MTGAPDLEAGTQERNVGPLPVEQRFAVQANRWAIIVGISKYKDSRLNLTWAHRDAQKLYELIQTPAGGGFEPERIELLIDGKATTAAVTRALRSFLKKPAREDVVLLYFACHGTPDVDRPSITYLLTHDTDPDDVSGTALPMREIDLSLQENLLAEKVVLIADTCHSASIGNAGGRRDSTDDAAAINAYLEQVSKAKGGVALLTSAESSETAREGKQWGDGHGVFTHFLLRGLEGAADGYGRPKDGVVSVGELFDYVRDSVKRATDDQQHPAIGTATFDRNLPMAITGGVSAREHFELGRRLLELARRLDEPERYLAAAGRFTTAITLSKMARATLPEAAIGLGQALLAAGDPDGCERAVQPLVDGQPPEGAEDALLLHGIARAKLGDPEAARAAFERFVARTPAHEYSGWTKSYLGRPQQQPGRRRTLLIGINEYLFPKAETLMGCVNDVAIMAHALASTDEDSQEPVSLIDRSATKAAIAQAFADLAEGAGADDTVVVHYSGHSVSDTVGYGEELGDTYLIVHDTVDAASGVTPAELHAWLQAIPSRHTTIIMDTHPRSDFLKLAEDKGDYRVLIASDSAQLAYETTVDFEGRLVTAGSFTFAVAKQLWTSDPETLTFGDLLDGTIRLLEGVVGPPVPAPSDPAAEWPEFTPQVPVLVGDREDLVFGVSDVHLWAYDFALRRTFSQETVERLRARLHGVPSDLVDTLPALGVSFGRAFIDRGAYGDAIDVLEQIAPHAGVHTAEALRLLATARLVASRTEEARRPLEDLAGITERPDLRASLVEQTAELGSPRRSALLVGIDQYLNQQLPVVRGATNDVRLLQKALVERCGFAAEDITVLVDGQATRAAILDAFRRLCDIARTQPALFHFSGIGSRDWTANPTIVSADGRTNQVYDINLAELAEIAGEPDGTNLVSVIDASFIWGQTTDGGRSAPGDALDERAAREVSLPEYVGPTGARISAIVVYVDDALHVTSSTRGYLMEREQAGLLGENDGVFGHLTYSLVDALVRSHPATLTVRTWLETVSELQLPRLLVLANGNIDEPLFENRHVREATLGVLRTLELEPIAEAVTLLRRLIDERRQQGDLDPAGRLDLGVACAETGDFPTAIDALERAVSLYRDVSVMSRERERDPRADDHLHEAHYQLGRVLYESGTDFTKAVSELDRAVELDPGNVRARYYLGQSIRQMVERETLAKATTALKEYLAMGAPLGDEDGVREFLAVRRAAQSEASSPPEPTR